MRLGSTATRAARGSKPTQPTAIQPVSGGTWSRHWVGPLPASRPAVGRAVPGSAADAGPLVEALANALAASSTAVVLVIDDYHVIDNPHHRPGHRATHCTRSGDTHARVVHAARSVASVVPAEGAGPAR
ncbi:MAG: hypothetical protein R2706_20540 [Acidimicrobiales bacterium]